MARTIAGVRLRERLGEEASEDLALAIDGAKDDMIAISQEKFDARLAIVASELRQDMTKLDANLRVTMTDGFSTLRREMTDGFSALRKEMSDMRVEMVRASFLFWLGQFAALVAVLGYVLRGLR
jgi:hypothetical protein